MVAVAGMTLSAEAQTDDGEVAQGRIIARIQDRTDDGVDDYRIEFGFFPEWAMDDKDPWTEAVTTWSGWLPSSRYLTKAVLDRRAAVDNRRWLRSSPISVPATAPQRGGGGADFEEDEGNGEANQITGRVIARYSPDSRGRLRVEFGFLPDWAFTNTASTEEAVERYGDDLLPRSRYLSASLISNRRGDWLRSSVVNVPIDVRGNEVLPPEVRSISCQPSRPAVDERVECTASLSGGAPDSYAWSGGDTSGSSATYRTSFSTSGSKTVRLTVRNSAGSDSDRTTLTVPEPPPVIDSISCSPSDLEGADLEGDLSDLEGGLDGDALAAEEPSSGDLEGAEEFYVGDIITCTASLSGGAPDSYSWSGGVSGSNSATYITSFSTSGDKTVRLTVSNDGGSDSGRATVYVEEEPVERPVIDDISCSPSRPAVNASVTCTASVRGDEPISYAWSGGASSGSSVRYSTSFGTKGRKTVSLTVSNAAGRDSGSTTVVVANRPPEAIGSISDVTVDIDGSRGVGLRDVGLGNRFRDPDGDPLTYYAFSSDSSTVQARVEYDASEAEASQASIALTGLREGSATIQVTAEDPDGDIATQTFRVTVRGVQRPEIRISCSPSTTTVNTSVTCTYLLLSGGEPTSHDWSGGDSSGGDVLDSDTYVTSFSTAGDRTVRLTARNSAGSDSDSTTVFVQRGNNPPEAIDSISGFSVDVDTRTIVKIRGKFRDPDGDDLTYGASSSDSSTVRASVSGSTVWLTGRRGGSATITVTADDGNGGTASVRFNVTVIDWPVIDSISCQPSWAVEARVIALHIHVGENITCTASLSGGTPDSYSWSGGSGGASGSNSATYITSFNTPGDGTVRLTVHNEGGSDSDRTTVYVEPEPEPEPNGAPIWSGGSDYEPIDWLQLGQRGVGCLSEMFSDPDGDTLTFTATSTSATIASVSLSDAGCYTVSALSLGLAYIQVTATDPHGASASRRLRVNVVRPNKGPECDTIGNTQVLGDISVAVGSSRTLTVPCTDPDGDRLTYTAGLRGGGSGAARVLVSGNEVTIIGVGAGTEILAVQARDPYNWVAHIWWNLTVTGG